MLFGSLTPMLGLVGSLLTIGPTPLPMISPSPLRVVQFVSGEQISAELLGASDQQLTLRLRGGSVVEVPKVFVATISQQPGWRNVVYENFETGIHRRTPIDENLRLERMGAESSQVWIAGEAPTSWSFQPSELLKSGRFGWTVMAGKNGQSTGQVRLTFQSGATTQTMLLRFPKSGPVTVVTENFRVATYPVLPMESPTRWTVFFEPNRVQVLADDAVVASGDGECGSLKKIELKLAANSAVGFDDLLLQTQRPNDAVENQFLSLNNDQDCLSFFDGNQIYGEVLRAGGRDITWNFDDQTIVSSWSDVRAICWKSKRLQTESHPQTYVSGLIAKVRFRSWLRLPTTAAPDELEVAVQRRDDGRYVMQHPLFGGFECPADQVAEIAPIFEGGQTGLLLQPLSFGGKRTRWQGTFMVTPDDQLSKQSMRLTVTGMEPAGPTTFLGSRYLRELRAGRMTTELWINNRRVGVLNEFFSSRKAESEIRIPIRQGVIRPGANTWEIRQTALIPNGSDFDRCQIGPAFIETELPDLLRPR